ncbi:MAG: type II secretion system F family protein [Candidatus Sungbacteria bacterium]|uniref:Type II secretion system F family protein n=1 Tax=Candidatus Sungiibacteriota bacterium TaxID=2750080 RepID=A0A9D6LTU5_9BACT|nr:type II secretion system F family protein [Candidatus Sungbacteria bacterium]
MLYHFTAIDRAGATIKGERETEDEKTLAKVLRQEGLLLTAAKTGRRSFSPFAIFTMSFGGISLVDKMIFARNVAVMVGAGLSMTRALEALAEQTKKQKLKSIIQDVHESITKGINFSQALGPHQKVFGDFFIHMIEAGEVSGKFEGSLKLLARQMKRDHDLRSKVKSAMMYPAIVASVLVLIGIMMLIFVVPTLTQTFKDLKVTLPPTTQFILWLSSFMQQYALLTGAGFIVFAFLFYRAVKSRAGSWVFDRIILHVPVIGPLVQKMNITRMARTLASLSSAGLSITKSLDITERVLGNSQFKASMRQATIEIEKGKPLAVVFKEYPKLYPPIVVEMVAVGEETGTLARMLVRVALFYEEEVNTTTKNLSSIVEPVMMVIIGVIVGFFAISMIQPLYSSLSQV